MTSESDGPPRLPTFDPEDLCAKCGSDDIKTFYKQDTATYDCRPHWVILAGREHLHRRCENCGYVWLQEPLSPAAVGLLRDARDERRREEQARADGDPFAPEEAE